MASVKLFVPPSLKIIDDSEKWLHETEIWQCLTDLDKNKQVPAIFLSLDNKIGKMCSDIQVKDLNNHGAVEILITKLKSLFLRHKSSGIPCSFKKPVNMNINHFINESERLYNKIKKYDMEPLTGVIAYRLLKSVVISEDKHQQARPTLPSLTYDCMEKQLKAIYDNISQENNLSSVKVEPVLETCGCNDTNRQIGYY